MHQVHVSLSDQLYKEAQRKAKDSGFPTVDEFIADVVKHGLNDDSENYDHLFTPERLATIDRAAAEIKRGQFYTPEQADAELAKTKEEWRRNHPR